MLKREEVERIKEKYPKGTPIRLYSMEGEHTVPPGSRGVVDHVVKQHFIPNLNFKLFLKTLFAFFTFILRFHHIIPKNCVYKRTGDFIKNKIQPVYMLGLKIVRPFWDEFYTGGL